MICYSTCIQILDLENHYSKDTFYYLKNKIKIVEFRICDAEEQRVFFNQHHFSCFAIKSLHFHQIIAQTEMKHENDQHDMLDDFFIFEKFENTDEFMQSFSLKNEYDSNANFLEISTLSSNVKNMLSILQKQKQTKQN